MRLSIISLAGLAVSVSALSSGMLRAAKTDSRPNILFAISDDQSYAHTSFAKSTFVRTPAFDRIAREGVYFANCYAASPSCAPSRSALVTGRYPWQNEQSGQHASAWLNKFVPVGDCLANNGYYVGRVGKGVAPFQYARSKADVLWREGDAAGVERSDIRYGRAGHRDDRFTSDIDERDYFANFRSFVEQRPEGAPFFFWYGSTEPHRNYEKDSWKRRGKSLKDVQVPGFLPDNDVIRGDMLDYAVEIEWFDLHLQRMLEYLQEIGELENTIVIVTADNGMPFPRAKADCFEYGNHVPLAIRYPRLFPGGRVVNGPVSLVDFAPTILDLTGTSSKDMQPITGQSMRAILESNRAENDEQTRQYVFAGRERHSASRYRNWGYPQRVIRSRDHLLIWNAKPERWPAGAPQRIKPGTDEELLPLYGIDENGIHHSEWAFTDIDGSPTKSFIIEHHREREVHPFFESTVGKRQEFEFYDIARDPFCLTNLAGNGQFAAVEKEMKDALFAELRKTLDPRVVEPDRENFDSYPRYSPMREFPRPGG